jgi:hypothetical protein
MEYEGSRERAGHVYLLHARTKGLYRLPGLEEIKERSRSNPARINAEPANSG